MAKQTTVVFYPHTARIYVGDYEHTGNELYIVNPSSTPSGVPLEFWKLENGQIVEMNELEKNERILFLEKNKIVVKNENNDKVHITPVGITGEELEEEIETVKDEFNQLVKAVLKDFHDHLDYIEKNNNLDKDFEDFKMEIQKQVKQDKIVNIFKIVSISIFISIILNLIMR